MDVQGKLLSRHITLMTMDIFWGMMSINSYCEHGYNIIYSSNKVT